MQARVSTFLSLALTVFLFLFPALPAFAGNWGENWGEMVWGAPEPSAGLAGLAALLTIGLLSRRSGVRPRRDSPRRRRYDQLNP